MEKQITCLYCGASDTILCKQVKMYAGVYRADRKIPSFQQDFLHEICKVCGTVVRSYVEDPGKL
jgi:hypothetical protein